MLKVEGRNHIVAFGSPHRGVRGDKSDNVV